MARTELTLASLLVALLACTRAGHDKENHVRPTTPSSPPPTSKAKAEPESLDDAALDELARACEGAELHDRFTHYSDEALARLASSGRPSLRLLASWERSRSFDAEGALARESADTLAEAITAELGVAPPAWWVDQLASAKLRPGDEAGPPYYDGSLGDHRDRRGIWEVGPANTHVRAGSGMVLSVDDARRLSFDLSMGRLELGTLPDEPGLMIEHARARAGTTIYYATFSPGSGGFRFPLHAVSADRGALWTAEVCGPDRKILGGLGLLIVEIVVVQPDASPSPGPGQKLGGGEVRGVAVYTAETHGVALDVFDPKTGARTLAWSSDFWFARGAAK